MTSRGGLDGSPAALGLVVGPVVGLGVHVDLQLILAKLAGQGPVERGQGGGPGKSTHTQYDKNASQSTRYHGARITTLCTSGYVKIKRK